MQIFLDRTNCVEDKDFIHIVFVSIFQIRGFDIVKNSHFGLGQQAHEKN